MPCDFSTASSEAKRWLTEQVPQIRERNEGTVMAGLPLTAVV